MTSPEILIVGGGPAGCAAASLLASWGHDVLLVRRPDAGPLLAESLPPSCGKLWTVLGAQEAIDRAGFIRTTGNTVWWGAEGRVESFSQGARGWQVTNMALAAVLLDLAREAGVRMEERRVTDDDLAIVPAAFRLDCSGRAGVLARGRGFRRYETDLRTVALTATWRRAAPWPVPDHTHTLIESYADGWAWSVPLTGQPGSTGERSVAVMIDPRATDLTRGHGVRELYLAEIAKTKQFSAILAEAALVGRPAGWDASMYSSERYADGDWLLVGDAGSFVDPVSSAGVMKALASGWLAAVVVHTSLLRPEMRAIAFDFYQAREQEVYAGLEHQTRQFLSIAAGGHAHPFWSGRTTLFDEPLAPDLHPERLRRDRSVQAAFAEIRSAPAIHLGLAPGVRIDAAPAVSGNEIVLERRLISARESVAFICDIDVVSLAELASTVTQVPDLYEACVRRAGPITLPDFLAALATLVARGWLIWR